jgi:hypothetical protein
VGAASLAADGCDGPVTGVFSPAFGAVGDAGCVAAGVDGAIGFWALLADARSAAEAVASTISFDARSTFDRQNIIGLQVFADQPRERFERAFIAARIDYMSRKLRIIWCPPSVSTLSTGKLRWRRPMITGSPDPPGPTRSVPCVCAVTASSAGSDFCSTMSE